VNVLSASRLTATTAATPAGTDEVVVTDANGTSAAAFYTYVKPAAHSHVHLANVGRERRRHAVTIKGTASCPARRSRSAIQRRR